ncbi:hypothetical protein [Dongia sp.]|uniref:hypothetical protein n=1 Tax=Dongia sp. TaxID=1977262 RepID=UPI0035B28B4C
MRFLGKTTDLSLGDLLRMPVLLAPLLLLALSGTWWGVSPLTPVLGHSAAMLVGAAVVQFVVCLPVYFRAGAKMLRLHVDGDTLLVAGASAAFALALWRYFHLTPAAGSEQLLLVWRDAAFGASLLSVAILGDILVRTAARSTLLPLRAGPAGRVAVGPGDLVPADGIVIDGHSEIQDPAGSDDVYPIVVRPGAHVHLGARNGDGPLTIELPAAETARQQAAGRPVLEDRLTQLLAWIARGTLAVIAAAIAWRVWGLGGPGDPVIVSLQMLALAAPLGLGLVYAAPTSEVLTAARAMGLEIKDLAVLDRLRHVGAVILGHRGILVPDRLRLISAHPIGGVQPVDLIRRAAAIAQMGHDPWGKAILDFAVGFRMRLKPASGYRSTIGKGIGGHTEKQEILIGSRTFVQSHGVDCTALDADAVKVMAQGRRVRWVAEAAPKRQVLGFLVFGAPSVSGAVDAVRNLRRMGLETAWIAHGEDPAHATLAKSLKIGRILPDRAEEKADSLRKLRHRAGSLLVVAADEVPEGMTPHDILLPFGRRLMEQCPETPVATTRHDPRVIVDLLLLAARHRQMVLINALIAYAAALLFALAPFWLDRRSDLGSYEVGVVLLLALSALSLRAMPTTANEVDEE